ncbi:Type 1 glutamine amidotransferase-like domain-containing protein [Knoellia locipacati]|uniref:Cyanophycinase n=1 Tax=Knoellia locipacati TaxID=882824 RepID=A0A512SY54_9MICO|nr:cyanophycinase [Knoellia locipacati]GEQ12878.1 cyanophycinase [Knoellia locipacati]
MAPTSRLRAARTLALSTVAVVAAGGVALAGGPASAGVPTTMTPIGGGYTLATLQGFARAAADGASGPTVDIVVIPSSYGDAPEDREENLALAQERTDQVDAACDAVVPAPFTGCTAVLAPLLNRADAEDPANSAMVTTQTDGFFILGGDQGLAMSILADTPAEDRMEAAFARGAAVGGTSAGAAVESRSMINGYVGDLGASDGLKRGSSLMWWGDDSDRERGLRFGSERAIYDQHFYQRGRFGRLLSTLATSDEHFGGRSKVGVGVDYATGVVNTSDRRLSGVFGATSTAVLDLETLRSPVRWVGEDDVLSTRNVVTHLLTPDAPRAATTYDLATRRLTLGRSQVKGPRAGHWQAPTASRAAGTVYLGGDVVNGDSTQVVEQFVAEARAATRTPATARIVVISLDASESAAAKDYAAALTGAGWPGTVQHTAYGVGTPADTTGATAVVVIGEDPTKLAAAVADRSFSRYLTKAVTTAPVVLADRHAAGVLGQWWSSKADPTGSNYEDEAIANFRSGDGQWKRGLGVVDGNVVPSLTYDYRWGKLFDIGQRDDHTLAVGIGEDTAIRLGARRTATVVGPGSAVVLDPTQARWWTGPNGAIGAANVLLNTYGDGERLSAGR